MRFTHKLFLSFVLTGLLFSCGGEGVDIDSEEPDGDELVVVTDAVLDSTQSLNTNITEEYSVFLLRFRWFH